MTPRERLELVVPEEPVRRQAIVSRGRRDPLTWLAVAAVISILLLAMIANDRAPRPAPTAIPTAGGSMHGPSSGNLSGLTAASRLVSGVATWYCGPSSACTKGYHPSDLVAAIDTSTGFGKGDVLIVRAFGHSVTVLVVDVCACIGGRVIDLTRGAFSKLANPDYGVIHVTLERVGAIGEPATAPPTDVEP